MLVAHFLSECEIMSYTCRAVPKKVIILDGTRAEDKYLYSILALLIDVLHEDVGTEVQTFSLRDISLNHCIGCFNCWIKTPGKCIHSDAGNDILRAIINSDTVIFFTPVVFGGYSSELKKITDRFLPLVLPFFKQVHNETCHPLRYATFPHVIGIGVHPHPYKKISSCFKTLVGRNAKNAHVSYAAEVISSLASSEMLRFQFQNLLSRTDALPGYKKLTSLMDVAISVPNISIGNRRALLIVGSPKIKISSTSGALGGYLLKRLRKYGWKIESLTLTRTLLNKKGKSDLCSAVDRADTIIFSAPLYYDALPFLATKAFEVIALHRETVNTEQPKNFLALVNNGFPESYQNAVALTICQNFAIECGLTWAGGLAMGAGEGLLSGHPATSLKGSNGFKRPPLYYVNRALNITAAHLAAGCPVPRKAAQLIAKVPIPLISFNLWRWMYTEIGKRVWKKEAVKNGLSIQEMFEKPYAK